MGSGVWNYLTGYVIIEIKGRGLERFLNRAAHSGAGLWRIRRSAADAVTARTGISGFYALRALVRGTGLRVRIIEKRGVPMKLYRMRKRLALAACSLLVLALLITASRFVWFVTVEGCDTVEPEAVIKTLEALGAGAGRPRNAVSTYTLGSKLIASDARIAWAGVRLEGVILRVKVREAAPYNGTEDGEGAASIYAAKDGIVTRVVVEGGKAAVVAGDAVVRGQLLISGVLWDDGEKRIEGRAKGAVTANVLYRGSYTAGPELMLPARTGEAEQGVRISLFGLELGGPDAGREGVTKSRWQLTNCFLPLRIEEFDSYALETRRVPADRALVEAEARERAISGVMATIPQDARILSRQTDIINNEDGSVTASVIVVTEENIAELRGIDGEGTNGG